ncbi:MULTISPECIES: agmatine deiminase family protein [Alteromonas]|uniref:agmatine deiminase family protein n=1 Tax=Alteromonas TaxID=226 RepID=UPI001E025BE6|nr:agmatine deiminase family protein [Alteromonas stellipolaris]MBZ2161189.1 agmatine deiminase family protein [Alteromonas stellipolaris]
MQGSRKLVPEWETVDAVMLAWPHAETDWSPWLEEARETYLNVIAAVNRYHAGVILLCAPDDVDDVISRLGDHARVLIMPASYNDTWVRDYGFLTCRDTEGSGAPVEFRFNGWGEKFDASEDNMANQRYLASLCKLPLRSSPVVAEGGALEIDDFGHLLSTSQCLLNPKRNGDMTIEDYAETFNDMLGCNTFTVLEHGHLEGDDTDGHIDTLVRFTPNKGLVIQAADNRKDDSHYAGLSALCEECATAMPEHEQYRLPLPHIDNNEGERLPASYANFLICNRAVLLPIYGQPEDEAAITQMQQAYPDHIIEPIDCSVLVKQFGSLHCISMQVPTNTLKESVISTFSKGVSVHATN